MEAIGSRSVAIVVLSVVAVAFHGAVWGAVLDDSAAGALQGLAGSAGPIHASSGGSPALSLGHRAVGHWGLGHGPGRLRHRHCDVFPSWTHCSPCLAPWWGGVAVVPYGGYGWGWHPGVVLAPVAVPAEELFGPRPIWRMFGGAADRREIPQHVLAQPQEAAGPVVEPAPPQVDEDIAPRQDGLPPQAAKPPLVPVSNAAARARAARWIQIGKKHFADEKFHSARERFKSAQQAAPELAESYFSQGHALLAMKQFERAAEAYRQGLERNNDWPESGFRWQDVYGQNEWLKKTHFEELALQAAENPLNGDLLFLMGVWLHFDGQPQRARAFFQRANALLTDPQLAGLFLSATPPEEEKDRSP